MLTEVRLTHENGQPTHPADHIRHQLEQDEQHPITVLARQLGALGAAFIQQRLAQSGHGTESGPDASSDSAKDAAAQPDDGTLDITRDNSHLTDHD